MNHAIEEMLHALMKEREIILYEGTASFGSEYHGEIEN